MNYGRAEALLERKWPEKYNAAGHLTWAGRVYGQGHTPLLGLSGRIYHGTWGRAPFQSLYQPAAGMLQSLPLMPEWYLVVVALAVLSALGFSWTPLFLALPCCAFAVSAPLVQAVLSAAQVSCTNPLPSRLTLLQRRTLTACLHLLQPLARLCGRLRYGLTPWRHSVPRLSLPWPRMSTIWTERWQDPTERLECLEVVLRASGAFVLRGGDYDRWDLAVCGGMLGATRILMAVEDHGAGTQFVRFHSWPRCSPGAVALTLLFTALALGSATAQAWPAVTMLGTVAMLLVLRTLQECAGATTAVLQALKQQKEA